MLAQADTKEKSQLSDSDVNWEATSLIIAGSDTTAVTLTYLIWAVLKRPDLQRRLEVEVASLDNPIQDTQVETLPLLNGVIEESLRLYGAAPGSLLRTVPATGATIDGHFLPAGTTVATQAFSLHRQGANFPDPYTFDETRFLDRSRLTDSQNTAFSPFGAGSRVCIGVHLARMELRLAAALFFRQCKGARLSPTMTDDMMEMENRFSIAPIAHKCEVTLQSS